MTEELTIRPAAVPDLPALLRLYGHLHPDAPAPTLDNAVRILSELSNYRGSAVFVACLGVNLVSTCTLIVVPNLTWSGTPYALIENVVTDAAYRGRGFAGRVLHHAVAVAWQRDCYKVMLLTGSKDPATLRFYTSVGFEQSKTGFQIRRAAEGAV